MSHFWTCKICLYLVLQTPPKNGSTLRTYASIRGNSILEVLKGGQNGPKNDPFLAIFYPFLVVFYPLFNPHFPVFPLIYWVFGPQKGVIFDPFFDPFWTQK